MSRAIYFVFFVCFIAAGLADPAKQTACSEQTQCAVSNLDINPCASKNRCLFKIGRNATITFDFTPEFDATELMTDVSWNNISFGGLEKDGCKATTCPVSAGVKQTYSYNLLLKKADVAKGSYDIKWTLWNKANKEQLCCFFTYIKLK